jgi:hypothetical protein
MFEKIARHSDLMNAMSRSAGVDLGSEVEAGQLVASRLRGAVLTCTQCRNVAECERYLAAGPEAADAIPDYCLNKAMIAGLKAAER